MAVRIGRPGLMAGAHVCVGSTVSSCGGKDRLALWASPEMVVVVAVVVACGKQRIRPSCLCASPPFPS